MQIIFNDTKQIFRENVSIFERQCYIKYLNYNEITISNANNKKKYFNQKFFNNYGLLRS